MSNLSDSSHSVELKDLTNYQFGDYHIFRKIGSGAMAEVYLAQQRSLSRKVALKILKPQYAKDEIGVKRFVREAKAAASLIHPNIVHIYEVNCIDGLWFIAQEYVPGVNLHSYLQSNGRLSPKQVSLILWQVASALQKASMSGIVHRDIKPDNILVSDSGEMKVADFGLAHVRTVSGEQKLSLTQTGMTLGTPLYMSPEQAEGKTLDHRSDIYSLGITAYHLLSGEPPFRGETAIATALLHLNKSPEPLSKPCPNAPVELTQIIHRMIEKLPDNRYQSITDLLDDINDVISHSFPEIFERLLNGTGVGLQQPILLTGSGFDDIPLEEATLHLQKSMQLETLYQKNTEKDANRKKRKTYAFIAVSIFCALLLGMFAAAAKNQSNTLNFSPPSTSTTVPKCQSIAEQWIYASQVESEDGWKSVINYDASESMRNIWVYKAQQQLALLYMKKGEVNKAYSIFIRFYDLPDYYNSSVRAFGFAGLFWYYAKRGDHQMMNQALSDFFLISGSIRSIDEPTNRVLEEAYSIQDRSN